MTDRDYESMLWRVENSVPEHGDLKAVVVRLRAAEQERDEYQKALEWLAVYAVKTGATLEDAVRTARHTLGLAGVDKPA